MLIFHLHIKPNNTLDTLRVDMVKYNVRKAQHPNYLCLKQNKEGYLNVENQI